MIEQYKYTDSEVKTIVDNMVILIDTREKKNKHITDYYDKHGINYCNRALQSGDYSFFIAENPTLSIPRPLFMDNDIIIERKASLEELSGNFTTGRTRFEEEFATSKAKKKYLLIENAAYSDIIEGNYNTQYNKNSFAATLHSFNHKYNLEVMFIPNSAFTPIYIYGVFKYYLKTMLR